MSRRAPGIASHAPAPRLQMQDQTTHQLPLPLARRGTMTAVDKDECVSCISSAGNKSGCS